MAIVQEYREEFNRAIDHLKTEISALRTGRATPAIVEDITVEAYGTKQPLKAVASIAVADARTLNVEPWDKSLMQAVETAIRNSSVGINPVNDGKLIRLPLPELTQERRTDLIKVLHQKLEQAKIAVRKIREDVRENIDISEKQGDMSEDDKYAMHEELEKMVREFNDLIKKTGEDKEKEIMTI